MALLFVTTTWVSEQEKAAYAMAVPTRAKPLPCPFTFTVILELARSWKLRATAKPPRLSVTLAPAAISSDCPENSVKSPATGAKFWS